MMWGQLEDNNANEIEARRLPFLSEHTARSDASVITLPVPRTATTMTPLTPRGVHRGRARFSGGSSLEIQRKIENASPETARHAALRMYESLKRHGLRSEAGRAFAREAEGDVEEIRNEGDEGVRKKAEELMGMEYLLKNGFVSYLRDMAKITPPIPQQVNCNVTLSLYSLRATYKPCNDMHCSQIWTIYMTVHILE